MGKTKPPYPEEFKQEAVRLVKTSDRPLSQIANELGVAWETLRKWVRQSDIDEGTLQGLSTDDHEELRRLRRENRILQQEREVLKKAAAFFAKESEIR